MGRKIESSIIDGDIEKKSLYGNEAEYGEEEYDKDGVKSALDSLESLEEDSYSVLGTTGEEFETLFDANTLGRATIDVPTTQKREAQDVEPKLSPEKIEKIGDDAQKIEEEFRARRQAMIDEIDNFF